MKRLAYFLPLFIIISFFGSCSDNESDYSQEELETILIETMNKESRHLIDEEQSKKGETYVYAYHFFFEKKHDSERTGNMTRIFTVHREGNKYYYGTIEKSFIWFLKPNKDGGKVHLTFEDTETMSIQLAKVNPPEWVEGDKEHWYLSFSLSDDPYFPN